MYVDENLQRSKYQATEVRFKFKSEHSIDNKFFDGELQIIHENQQKEKLIISLFLQISKANTKKFDSLMNKFKILAVEDRKRHKVWFSGCLNAKPNLIDLLGTKNDKEQLTDILNMSFYTYKGSDTLPPCYEQVRWIIYESPL